MQVIISNSIRIGTRNISSFLWELNWVKIVKQKWWCPHLHFSWKEVCICCNMQVLQETLVTKWSVFSNHCNKSCWK